MDIGDLRFSSGAKPPGAGFLRCVEEAAVPLDAAFRRLASVKKAPEERADIQEKLPMSEDVLLAQIMRLKAEMEAVPPHEDVTPEQAAAIALLTLDDETSTTASLRVNPRELINAWLCAQKRSISDMLNLAPAIKLGLTSLQTLPPALKYRGKGVRVITKIRDDPHMEVSFKNPQQWLKVGSVVSFYGFALFSKDDESERRLHDFLLDDERCSDSEQMIILQCENLQGYSVDTFSLALTSFGMGSRSSFTDPTASGRVLLTAPSFFLVSAPPRKVGNKLYVKIEQQPELASRRSYLPKLGASVGSSVDVGSPTSGSPSSGGTSVSLNPGRKASNPFDRQASSSSSGMVSNGSDLGEGSLRSMSPQKKKQGQSPIDATIEKPDEDDALGYTNVLTENDFDGYYSGLCSCLMDIFGCIDFLFCYPCQVGRIYSAIHSETDTHHCAVCVCATLTGGWLNAPCWACYFRRSFEVKFEVECGFCLHCCGAIWSPCSICQMYRELTFRGYYPGKAMDCNEIGLKRRRSTVRMR